jgi:DNA polymerase-3 subunit alpha
MSRVADRINKGEDFDNKIFFESDEFYLPSPNEAPKQKIDISECEEYDILAPPMLPKFKCPEGQTENEYLTQLCREGWRSKLMPSDKVQSKENEDIYVNRIKKELDVIKNADLSGYFLIVRDIIKHVEGKGWLAGPGRGSAAGCLVSYLVDITKVDPIQYDLLFERFYNEGRNTADHVSLPDIDVDVPAEHRDEVIDYIKSKYGYDNVSQMLTFGRLQGRAALKEVMRINSNVSFSEMNEVTKAVPNEAEISDQLQDMDDKSIIKWTLMNEPDKLVDWCKMNEDGSLEGDLADIFEQAIRIEGTFKSQGKHAAGVIISKHRLEEVCPMVKDKSGNPMAGLEMNDLEAMGHVKFDILGIDLLTKIMEIKDVT